MTTGPTNPTPDEVVSAVSVTALGSRNIQVVLSTPSLGRRKVVLPSSLATFDNVTWVAAAVGTLQVTRTVGA